MSSGRSPAIAVRMSVGVTMPSSPPYSSTTTAIWTGFSRNISSSRSTGVASCTMSGWRTAARDVEASGARHLVEQVLGVDDAGQLVEALAPGRVARVAALGDLAADRLGRIVEVDPHHLHARRHHASDRAVGEAQHAVDHVALGDMEDAGARALRDQPLHLLLGHRACPAGRGSAGAAPGRRSRCAEDRRSARRRRKGPP